MSPDGKSVYVASVGSDAVAHFNRNTTSGVIAQPAGTAGCISQAGAGGCADGHGLSANSGAVAVSPTERASTSPANFAVVRLDRNTTTGALSQPAGTAGCISQTGAGTCADGHALHGAAGGGEPGRKERLRRS